MPFGKGNMPELKPLKPERRAAVVFADYGKSAQARHWAVDARERYPTVETMYHPADMENFRTLDDMWERCDVAIGGTSTVLVEAVLNGLHIDRCDPIHVCAGMTDRERWLIDLSWAIWNHTEIVSGDFWEHLC
jgi:hypothetical protein